jgi:regulatory protein YycI of two-component signal transduction system YycFG
MSQVDVRELTKRLTKGIAATSTQMNFKSRSEKQLGWRESHKSKGDQLQLEPNCTFRPDINASQKACTTKYPTYLSQRSTDGRD